MLLLVWETENYHVMRWFWAVFRSGVCFLYTFIQKQSPDGENRRQQSHHMIVLSFRIMLLLVVLVLLLVVSLLV